MAYFNSSDVASPEYEINDVSAAGGTGFFADAKNKHSDLKAMLDSSKEALKIDAMKRIINMMARGKDVSDLFPPVVKNVAAKSLELKKLVYVYLVRYAEEQQDLALLSISTFQRALKDPNQLIRASAMRVLSSIRVPMISPIVMLSIKECIRDMSPYVRKVAAHAIPKLYELNPELKDQLIEIIDHVLADKTTLVIGSAVYAFEEVCPDRLDLLHKHYRKLCQLLVDVDEWGQVVVVNCLTRYARTQFLDPNFGVDDSDYREEKFYSDSDESSSSDSDDSGSDKSEKEAKKPKKKPEEMDPDLRMLLRNSKPLLQSRSSAVVMAVSQLYFNVAPKSEVGIIAKAMVRLLRAPKEVQNVVLVNIATISAKRPVEPVYAISKSMFEPFLKSFFVRSSDSTSIKLLKLEILTNLATQLNISIILREFQTYVHSHDKEFASAAIDSIARCAIEIQEVTEVCLSGLVGLMSSKSEAVVAQSVVALKRLLQLQPSAHESILRQMAKLLNHVRVPAARASILWLLGEYCRTVPRVAPDVLRMMAKNFINEELTVKMQIINLAVKLLLTNPEQTRLLCDYVFQLARYDQSYDLRDRARFLRNLIAPHKEHKLVSFAPNIFLNIKPAPLMESQFKNRDTFRLGSLSHYLNQRCSGYSELTEFPSEAPDTSVRNVEGYGLPLPSEKQTASKSAPLFNYKKGGLFDRDKFYSDEEEESETPEESSEEESDSSDEGETESETSESASSSVSSDEESSSESEEEEERKPIPAANIKVAKAEKKTEKIKRRSPSPNLLLDFQDSNEVIVSQPIIDDKPLQPSKKEPDSKQIHRPTNTKGSLEEFQTAPAQHIPTRTHELFTSFQGEGVRCLYRFTRSPSLFSANMCSVELQFDVQKENLTFGKVRLLRDKSVHSVKGFPTDGLDFKASGINNQIIGIDFHDTTQPVDMSLELSNDESDDKKRICCQVNCPVGEQIEPLLLTQAQFNSEQEKLSGLNETSGKISLKSDEDLSPINLINKIYDIANVLKIQNLADENKLCFCGRTLYGKSSLLISLLRLTTTSEIKLIVNCEKMVIGSMLFKEIKNSFL